jgi:hypothetical protein
MTRQTVFPAMAMSAAAGDPSITLQGQKVLFDKKVSLLPVDIKKEGTSTVKGTNGRN